jgi:hypothetical protein
MTRASNPSPRSFSSLSRAALAAGLLGGLLLGASCGQKLPCDNAAGSCLELTVQGTGDRDRLHLVFTLQGKGDATWTQDLIAGLIGPGQPVLLRLLPPEHVLASQIATIQVVDYCSAGSLGCTPIGRLLACGSTDPGFVWQDGAHEQASLTVFPPDPTHPCP